MPDSETRFVVTGCARSGTMFAWRMLNWLGVRTSFEEFFNAQAIPNTAMAMAYDFEPWLESTGTRGEISHLAAPYVGNLRDTVRILHLVRNPVAVIASFMGIKWFSKPLVWGPHSKFAFRYIPEMDMRDEALVCCMKYWLYWNRLVETATDTVFCSESLATDPQELKTFAQLAGGDYDQWRAQAAMNHLGTTWNAKGRDLSIRWQKLPEGDLKDAIAEAAQRYGYTMADLREYCPHCGQL